MIRFRIQFFVHFAFSPHRLWQPSLSKETLLSYSLENVFLEVVYIPAGTMMGSTAEEKAWATGIEGGAQPGTDREQFEGEPRGIRNRGILDGTYRSYAWAVQPVREETGYVTMLRNLTVGRRCLTTTGIVITTLIKSSIHGETRRQELA